MALHYKCPEQHKPHSDANTKNKLLLRRSCPHTVLRYAKGVRDAQKKKKKQPLKTLIKKIDILEKKKKKNLGCVCEPYHFN